MNVITLANVEADISTSPFNFHFADSPIDLTISPSIPLSANITFSGDIGANADATSAGALRWDFHVDGYSIASASGILSTLGFGVCGGIAGISMGFGETWGSTPQIYASGCCDLRQYQVRTWTWRRRLKVARAGLALLILLAGCNLAPRRQWCNRTQLRRLVLGDPHRAGRAVELGQALMQCC